MVEDAIYGLVGRRPTISPALGTVGLGPSLLLDSAEQSFHVASRNLDTAQRLDWGGCFDISDLSWRIALISEPEIGVFLVSRYLKPLEDYGEYGALLVASVREYLSAGRHLGIAARRLHLHVNSLRHRLHRFEEIVGVNLEEPDVSLELHWALEKAALDQLPGGR